jgi:hypothetical protein
MKKNGVRGGKEYETQSNKKQRKKPYFAFRKSGRVLKRFFN